MRVCVRLDIQREGGEMQTDWECDRMWALVCSWVCVSVHVWDTDEQTENVEECGWTCGCRLMCTKAREREREWPKNFRLSWKWDELFKFVTRRSWQRCHCTFRSVWAAPIIYYLGRWKKRDKEIRRLNISILKSCIPPSRKSSSWRWTA